MRPSNGSHGSFQKSGARNTNQNKRILHIRTLKQDPPIYGNCPNTANQAALSSGANRRTSSTEVPMKPVACVQSHRGQGPKLCTWRSMASSKWLFLMTASQVAGGVYWPWHSISTVGLIMDPTYGPFLTAGVPPADRRGLVWAIAGIIL